MKTAFAKGYYDEKTSDQLKEEYIETVNLGVDQFDFQYFPAKILLNKPQSLTRTKVYIAINYHSFAFCHNEKASPRDKQLLWYKTFS